MSCNQKRKDYGKKIAAQPQIALACAGVAAAQQALVDVYDAAQSAEPVPSAEELAQASRAIIAEAATHHINLFPHSSSTGLPSLKVQRGLHAMWTLIQAARSKAKASGVAEMALAHARLVSQRAQVERRAALIALLEREPYREVVAAFERPELAATALNHLHDAAIRRSYCNERGPDPMSRDQEKGLARAFDEYAQADGIVWPLQSSDEYLAAPFASRFTRTPQPGQPNSRPRGVERWTYPQRLQVRVENDSSIRLTTIPCRRAL